MGGCKSQTDESGGTTISQRSAAFLPTSGHRPGGAPPNRVSVTICHAAPKVLAAGAAAPEVRSQTAFVTICHLHAPVASANPIRPSESLSLRPTPIPYSCGPPSHSHGAIDWEVFSTPAPNRPTGVAPIPPPAITTLPPGQPQYRFLGSGCRLPPCSTLLLTLSHRCASNLSRGRIRPPRIAQFETYTQMGSLLCSNAQCTSIRWVNNNSGAFNDLRIRYSLP